MFIILGLDIHAPALIRLWALMREREGEDPEVVAEALGCATIMEDEAQAKGKVVLSLDAILSLAASLKAERSPGTPQNAQEGAEPVSPLGYTLREGQIVCSGRGRPARLVKIFGDSDKTDEKVRGMANIQVPGHGVTTVTYATLRPALPEEIEAYRNSGGRL